MGGPMQVTLIQSVQVAYVVCANPTVAATIYHVKNLFCT